MEKMAVAVKPDPKQSSHHDFKKILIYTHVSAIIIACLNSIADAYIGYRLANFVIFSIKALLYLSGTTLFFYYLQPFKKRVIYFGIYLFTPLIAIVAWIFDGILGVVLVSIFLYVFLPDKVAQRQDNKIVYSQFSGFIGGSARYSVKQNFYIVEKDLGHFNLSYDKHAAVEDIRILNDTAVVVTEEQYDEFNNREIVSDTISFK